MSSSDLLSILHESQRLAAPLRAQPGAESSGRPSVHRSIPQLESLSLRLATAGGGGGGSAATALLASRGADPEKLRACLSRVDLRSTLDPMDGAVADADVAGYLRHMRQMSIVSAMEESRALCAASVGARVASRVADEWSRRRSDLLAALGRSEGVWRAAGEGGSRGPAAEESWRGGDSSVGFSYSHDARQFNPNGASSFMSPGAGARRGGGGGAVSFASPAARGPATVGGVGGGIGADGADGLGGGPGSRLTAKMLGYARVIASLNARRTRRDPFPVVAALVEAARTAEEPGPARTEVEDSFEAIAAMIGEKPGEGDAAPAEGVHAGAVRDRPADFEADLARGACAFLEAQYDRHITAVVRENPNEARLGPRPGLAYRVRGYMNVMMRHGDGGWPADLEQVFVDGAPVWPQVYFCLRCGDVSAAAEIARSASAATAELAGHLDTYGRDAGRTLPQATWSRIVASYNQFSRGGAVGGGPECDPYKLAVYNLLGRCDVERMFPRVLTMTADFLWYRLRLVTDGAGPLPPALAAHAYPLSSLQRTVVDFGPSHFSPMGRSPMLYFRVLLLTAQPERAVQYLSRCAGLETEALHAGLALAYYGAVRHTASAADDILVDAGGSVGARLNVARLVRQYVRPFAATDTRAALEYLAMIGAGSSGAHMDGDGGGGDGSGRRGGAAAGAGFSAPLGGGAGGAGGAGVGRGAGGGFSSPSAAAGGLGNFGAASPSVSSIAGASPFRRHNTTGAAGPDMGGVGGVGGGARPGNLGGASELVAVRDAAVRDLAVQTGEYDTLLGSVSADGSRRHGCVSRLLGPRAAGRIARLTAETCEADGRYEAAVRLFDLCGDHDRVVGILNAQLGHVLSSPGCGPEERARFADLARSVAGDYTHSDTLSRVRDPRGVETLRLLLALLSFFDLAAEGRGGDAMAVAEGLGILPSGPGRSDAEEKARAFEMLDERVRRVFGDVVHTYMTLLHAAYEDVRRALESAERQARLNEIRAKSSAVVTFAGMIHFHVAGDANARIIRLHVLMS